MKYILAALLSFLLGATSLRAGELGDLNAFQSVTPISGGIRISFKPSGMRYNFQIEAKEREISAYNASVDVPFGQHAEFSEKHSSIVFEPVSDNHGESFRVTKRFDGRSFGGPETTKEFILSVQFGKIVFGEVNSQ